MGNVMLTASSWFGICDKRTGNWFPVRNSNNELTACCQLGIRISNWQPVASLGLSNDDVADVCQVRIRQFDHRMPAPPDIFCLLESRRCVLAYISRPLRYLYHNQKTLILSYISKFIYINSDNCL